MFKIDVKPQQFEDLDKEVQREGLAVLRQAASSLATQTYGHIVEEVQDKLHSTRQKYLEALTLDQIDDNTWVVRLDSSANWIEDGMDRHEMVDQLLNGGSQAYIAKDGSKYKIIPFSLNKPPSQVTSAMRQMQAAIKAEFKKQNIPYGKVERGEDGQPLVGNLHKLDILDKPVKTQQGPGQGHGPIGQVRQGLTGTPFLKAVNVFQRQLRGPAGQLQVKRDVMTFRVVSSKHKGSGRWIHPGIDGKKFFEEAYRWASGQWEKEIKPQVLAQLGIQK